MFVIARRGWRLLRESNDFAFRLGKVTGKRARSFH
jgi:hypothetical protein